MHPTRIGPEVTPNAEVPQRGGPRRSAAEEAQLVAGEIFRLVQARTSGQVRGLRVEVRSGEIRLSGKCASFYIKQLAQQAAIEHLDTEAIVNEIDVA